MEATRKAAIAKGDTRYFTGVPCKHGHVSHRRAATGECLECRTIALAAWRKKNPTSVQKHNKTQYDRFSDKLKEYTRSYARKNAESVNAYHRAYQKKNLHKFAAINAKRKAAKLKRTPSWLTEDDFWMIKQAYELAAMRTKLFGFVWHVDHIIPLQGKRVSGLHVPLNMQVVPAIENRRKSNSFEVSV